MMNHLTGAKHALIERLRENGITDEKVLNAFNDVERHRFLESFLWTYAYEDKALKLFNGQTMSRPFTVAFQSQLMEIKDREKVLEIGTGSGFQAAILSSMGAKVYSIERQLDLYRRTKSILDKIDSSIFTIYGDGYEGLPQYAPFDKIIVTCGAPYLPPKLFDQLKIGGFIIIPIGNESQTMKKIIKTDEKNYQEETYGNFDFVPMLKDTSKK